MQKISDIRLAVVKITLAFASAIMLLMVALVVIEIIMRWGFGKSTMISTDFVAYGMGIVFYWGASKAMEDNIFVRMDILYDHYKGKFRKIVNVIFDLIFLLFNCNITYYFFILLQNTFERDLKATNIYQTPLWLPRLLLFIGIVLFNVYLVCRIISDINDAKGQCGGNREYESGKPQENKGEKGGTS